MPANTRLGLGGHKDLLIISVGASNAPYAKSFALKVVLSRMPRDILKPIYFIAKVAVSALGSAGPKPLSW